jgi:hypothetical protein
MIDPALSSPTSAVPRRPSSTRSRTPGPDAIALLKADHREFEALFAAFEDSHDNARKRRIATAVCKALRIHTQLEEEVLYPACRTGGVDPADLDEAVIEHATAEGLIGEVEAGSVRDPLWHARVKVLGELIEHHVKEEEERGGLFAQARKAGLPLKALGEQMADLRRKLETGRGG